jgi:hypothetical protein
MRHERIEGKREWICNKPGWRKNRLKLKLDWNQNRTELKKAGYEENQNGKVIRKTKGHN